MPGLAHRIQNFIQNWFTTLGTLGSIFIFVTTFAPRVLVSNDKGRCSAKWLSLMIIERGRYITTPGTKEMTWMVFISQRRDDFILDRCVAVFATRRE